jgi:molybdopterin molybdotransferase
MRGLVAVDRPEVTAVVVDGWRSPAGRTQHMPVRFEDKDTSMEPRIRRAGPGGSDSHLVAALVVARGRAVVEADVVQMRPGDRLRVTRVDR